MKPYKKKFYKKKRTVKRKKWGGSRLPDGPRIMALITSSQYHLVPEFMRRAARQADAADAARAAARAAERAAAAASQRIVRRTGALRGNDEYNPTGMPVPQFTVSRNVLNQNSHYMDWEEMDEKNVVDALNGDPYALAFKIHHSFYVITKGKLFELMNNPVSIKYECSKLCKFETDGLSGISRSSIKAVPYLSISSFSQIQGLVSFFDLWHIISSQQPQQSQAYELVETHRPRMLSMASHDFLFGSGAAGERAFSAAHCQAGQDASSVYEIRILPIERRRSRSGSRSHSRSRSRSRTHRAATTIQRLIRSRRSRRKAVNRDS
jgi:hypothetical protein